MTDKKPERHAIVLDATQGGKISDITFENGTIAGHESPVLMQSGKGSIAGVAFKKTAILREQPEIAPTIPPVDKPKEAKPSFFARLSESVLSRVIATIIIVALLAVAAYFGVPVYR